MISLCSIPVRLTSALFICALIASGCSDSGGALPSTGTGTVSESGASVADNDSEMNDPNEQGTPNPEAQHSIRVDFEITVPAYVSDALQVGLTWGDKDIAATWIGDEFWTASDDFPAETEQLLSVTFYDQNGGITLGNYETNFGTGTNAAETFQIAANQFNTDRWDNDQDGVSNINELIAGTPVNGSTIFPILDTFQEPAKIAFIKQVSSYYETRIPKTRPYYEHSENYQPYDRELYNIEIAEAFTIDLDESGNGLFSDTYESWEPSNTHIENHVATRKNVDNVITWAGADEFSDSSAGLVENIEFNITTRTIDGHTRQQNGTISRDKQGDWGGGNFSVSISYSLTGKMINDTPYCEPVSGTITLRGNSDRYSNEGNVVTQSSITKIADDQYWTVKFADSNGIVTDTYLTEDLGASFYCAFVAQ